jgi:transposase InsO family protein
MRYQMQSPIARLSPPAGAQAFESPNIPCPQTATISQEPSFSASASGSDSGRFDAMQRAAARVRLNFIRSGKPIENAYIESFHGRFRDECLNERWFLTMAHARRVIEHWRVQRRAPAQLFGQANAGAVRANNSRGLGT